MNTDRIKKSHKINKKDETITVRKRRIVENHRFRSRCGPDFSGNRPFGMLEEGVSVSSSRISSKHSFHFGGLSESHLIMNLL